MLALAPLAVILIAAALFCGILGYLLARQSDDRNETERRQAIASAVKEYRSTTGVDAPFDPALVRLLAKTSGLHGLRFDAEPSDANREVQSLVEDGRFIGWLSWDRERPVTDTVSRLWPIVTLGLVFLSCFIALVLWHLRRSGQALAATQVQVHAFATDRRTGLPNRRLIDDVLDRALKARMPDRTVALLLLEIERLDELAEPSGQGDPDRLLGMVAERLEQALPRTATLGIFGSGRFAAIIEGEGPQAAWATGRAMLSALADPFVVRGESLALTGKVGFATAPEHGSDIDAIMRRAGLALDAAKADRHAEVMAFATRMEAEYQQQQSLKRALQRAVAERAFHVEYQPIVTADRYRMLGVEALLRWNHPQRGPIAPTEFIPLAERYGLMDSLGEFVLQRALDDAKRWPDLQISINLSPVQLRDSSRVASIIDTVRRSAIDPHRIVLEITEGVLIDDPETIKLHLQTLRAQGLQIALDDFGAGYSSLAYLRHFAIDKLKIDKGFVAPLGRSPDAGVIIQAIVALGRALGLTVVVEGVETEEQRVLLRLAGCDEMQGFLFGKPVAAAEIDRLLKLAEAAAPERRVAASA